MYRYAGPLLTLFFVTGFVLPAHAQVTQQGSSQSPTAPQQLSIGSIGQSEIDIVVNACAGAGDCTAAVDSFLARFAAADLPQQQREQLIGDLVVSLAGIAQQSPENVATSNRIGAAIGMIADSLPATPQSAQIADIAQIILSGTDFQTSSIQSVSAN